MSSQNTYFDLPSFVSRYMLEGIEKYHFLQGRRNGDVVTLTNPHCIIYLQNFGEGIGFKFAAIADPETKFSLSKYLDAFVDGGRQKYCPEPPQGLDLEKQFVLVLQGYNAVLTSKALAVPLSGDFTWVPNLISFNVEYEMLEGHLFDLIDLEHPDGLALRKKWSIGDLTWMQDVKRILSEQGS